MPTWIELAQSVASEFGVDLSPEDADGLLWEHTGFPSFWRTIDPITECSEQLRAVFRKG